MRKSFDARRPLVQTQLHVDPFTGHVFVFLGRRGDRIKRSLLRALIG
jgi:transposase